MESWKFSNRDEMNLYETYERMIYYRNIGVFCIYRFEQDVAVIFFLAGIRRSMLHACLETPTTEQNNYCLYKSINSTNTYANFLAQVNFILQKGNFRVYLL